MQLTILTVPYSLDAPYNGMGNAPDALLAAGLAQRLGAPGCQPTVVEIKPNFDGYDSREERIGHLLAQLGAAVAAARHHGSFPLVIGGDCLTALGTIAGLGDPANTGIAWFDAHGDFNTPETTVSGYLGGMPLACAVGRGLDALRAQIGQTIPVPEQQVALFGVRDLDSLEAEALAASQLRIVRADALQHEAADVENILETLAHVRQIYVHLDIDVLDPAVAPGVDYPTPGGLDVAQLQRYVEQLVTLPNVAALALTAVNPDKDGAGRTVKAALAVLEAALTTLRRSSANDEVYES